MFSGIVSIAFIGLIALAFWILNVFQGGRRWLVEWLIRQWFPKYHMVRIRKRIYEGPAAQAAEAFRQIGQVMTGGMGDATHKDQAD